MIRYTALLLVVLGVVVAQHHEDGKEWKFGHEAFRSHHCLKTMKGILKYSCLDADNLVPCVSQFQPRIAVECLDIFNKTINGLTACQADTKLLCEGKWGLGSVFKTPVHCLADQASNLTTQCIESEMMGFALHAFGMQRRPRCFMLGWALGFFVVLSGIIWVVKEKRNRAKARSLRWEAEGYKPTAQGSWSTGLFGSWNSCMPHWSTCFPSFFWPTCQQAILQSEMRDRDCNIGDLCTNLSWAQRFSNIFHTRQELRSRLDMPDAPVSDCIASALCQPCALAQHARELNIRQHTTQTNAAYAPQVGVPLVDSWQPTKESIV